MLDALRACDSDEVRIMLNGAIAPILIVPNEVKQEMARMNIHVLRISELKWTRIGKFNSEEHYIYYCRQESLRRSGVVLTVNKRV